MKLKTKNQATWQDQSSLTPLISREKGFTVFVSEWKILCLLNVMSFFLAGCSTTDPHENFKAHLNKAVGVSVDIEPMLSMCAESQKIVLARYT